MGDKTVYQRVDELEVRVVELQNALTETRMMLSNLEKRLFVIPKGDQVRHKPFTIREGNG